MHDFEFHNPTRIVFGRGKEGLIGSILKKDGIGKVLLLTGQKSVKASGLHGRVSGLLKAAGVNFVELGGVCSNPVVSHARQGVGLARKETVDAVLALGGGSVLDEGKAIAVGATVADDIWNYYLGKPVPSALPVYAILTLAATGSEMNGNSVVTNEETRQKYHISSIHAYPRVSILNPELTQSVPPDYTAYGAVDVIAHVIEGYFTKQPGTRLQDRLVESLIHSIIESTNIVLRKATNYEARAQFMWTATLALNGLTQAGVGPMAFPNHMIEHSLSALYNIAHGAGLAIVIPAWMKWYRPRNPGQFDRFAREIFGLDSGLEGIDALERWFREIGAPTRLSDAGIPAGDIESIARNVMGQATLWGEDQNYPLETVIEILSLAA